MISLKTFVVLCLAIIVALLGSVLFLLSLPIDISGPWLLAGIAVVSAILAEMGRRK